MSEPPDFSRTGAAARRPSEAVSPGSGPPDGEVVAQVLRGDREAFRVLVERYERKVYGLALGHLGGDRERAADAAQEIFWKLYRGLRGFQQNARFSTWLHRVAVNHLISEIRKLRALKRGRPLSLDAPLRNKKDDDFRMQVGERSGEPTRRLQNEERGARILSAIEELDEDLRTAVALRDLQDRSYEEIAEILSIPVGTVRSRLHRAREILRHKLKHLL